ncbi:MAG TPA: amidohydrolase family protein [Pyrinomonadaceae bacterium]|nr:amidohydrolase family protein [Pyrinomonadaceae bacterium]
MSKLYRASWVVPISSEPFSDGSLVVDGQTIIDVGPYRALQERYPDAQFEDLGEAAIIPGLVNAHSHLELTAMRGYLDDEEGNFFAWLKKLTRTRLEKMSVDDLYVSAIWGAIDAIRAGVTCVGDASDSAFLVTKALRETGLRGIVYQESFGPDPKLAEDNFKLLKDNVAQLREIETPLVRAGVSPHAPYSVCARQLELISAFAIAEKLPVMMHTAESHSEELLLKTGTGPFADGLVNRGIEWKTPGVSTVQYLRQRGVLDTRPLLTHCITVDDADIQTIKESGAGVAHCPKSNAKLGHGRAPFSKFLKAELRVGLGSDSVASNNLCDLLEESRYAVLSARAEVESETGFPSAKDALRVATEGGARALGLSERIGVLEAGAQADFVGVRLSGSHQVPNYDPYATLVFASSARDVMLTVIDGREVFREGHLTTVDEERVLARMDEISRRLGS